MNDDTISFIIVLCIFFSFFFGIAIIGIIDDKVQKNHELKKLGILKPKTKNTRIIKAETDYNAKLEYQLKFWIINIVAVIIICLICKLFGFGISDIINLIK